MNSDEKKSDDYWMGVRDALRMIDSFYRWSKHNPKRAKKLDDFIADGLIAAAKRCESCLSRELGVGFKEKEDEHESSVDIKEIAEASEIPVFFEESSIKSTKSDATPETPLHIEAPPSSEPILDEKKTEPFDIDDSDSSYTERTSRDFSSEFELVEPEPLITKPEESDSEMHTESIISGPPEIEIEEELHRISDSSESPSDTDLKSSSDDLEHEIQEPKDLKEVPSIDEGDIREDTPKPSSSTDDESILEERKSSKTTPRFSWDDHDETTPSSDSDIEPSEPKESTSAKVRIWSPYDEPTILESTDSDSISKEVNDATEESHSDTKQPTTDEPPAPPPPPESDEDEEERKRKARRLFFGT